MIDWNKVLGEAIAAARQVIGGQWPTIANSATTQITSLVENAKFIEDNKASMSAIEYNATKINQQEALKGVLATFAAITIMVAEQVAAAVWGVVEAALKTIPELAAFI